MAEHVEALEAILSTAAAEGLKFSPAKCTFAVGSLILLGRKVSGAGVAVWQDRAAAIRELARPTTLRELYHALGLFGYYRSFVRNFASVAEPLTRLTKGWRYEQADGRYRLVNVEGKPTPAERCVLDWGEAQQRSFEALKDAIASPPVLAHPDPARPYIVYVDASKEGFGVVVHQILEADSSVVSQSVAAAQLHALEFARLPPAIARERWTSWLRADRYFAPILRDAEQATDGASADGIWVVENGVLIRRHDGRLALPEGAIPELLRSVHEHNGHFGFYKTYLALARDFWRSGLSTMVRSWVKHCRVCQATKAGRKTRDLDVTKDSQLPFDTISIDIVHGLPLSRAGNNAAVVVLCTFSRMVLIEPCSLDVTAEGVAAILSNRVLRYEWRPRRIISDSESRLTGAKMTALARSLGASITPSSPYHQQANAVERAIQTIQHVLQSMSMDSRAHWDRRHAPAVELAINSTPSVITGHRPFDLVFVSHPSIVHAVFDDAEHLGVGSFDERLAAACERLVEARELTNVARAEQKRRYDRFHAPLVQLRVGDRVFLRLKDRPVTGAIGDKLDSRKMGPFPVSEVLSDHRVRLELPADVLIDPIVSVEQIDLVPRSPDPFAAQRDRSLAPSPGVAGRAEALEDVPAIPAPADLPIAPRSRRLPALLRGFDLGVLSVDDQSALLDALREPIRRPRALQLGDRSLLLVERPVVFLSRLTSVMEKKMVACELELRCLAWAFAKLAHLLDGALVTVITDHQPMGAMLTSTSGVNYGPAISRCRALMMPHLPNLRFVARAGHSHANADALSRLATDPGRSSFLRGHVLDALSIGTPLTSVPTSVLPSTPPILGAFSTSVPASVLPPQQPSALSTSPPSLTPVVPRFSTLLVPPLSPPSVPPWPSPSFDSGNHDENESAMTMHAYGVLPATAATIPVKAVADHMAQVSLPSGSGSRPQSTISSPLRSSSARSPPHRSSLVAPAPSSSPTHPVICSALLHDGNLFCPKSTSSDHAADFSLYQHLPSPSCDVQLSEENRSDDVFSGSAVGSPTVESGEVMPNCARAKELWRSRVDTTRPNGADAHRQSA
ncbi:hypothetical protein CF319_g8629 [Tilletia indica]|nr:hypothetical protein CF319_g8629 [Tilletia indica]